MRVLQGKVAFITGGASGIGLGMAEAFLGKGMSVIIADNSPGNLRSAADHLARFAGEFSQVRVDVTDRAGMARAAAEAEAKFGPVQVLCNNAAIGIAPPMVEADYADWERLINVNLYGVINGIGTFLPRLREHGDGGHIVNTASMAGIIPIPEPGGIYATTKFAVRGLSESLRLALAPFDIGVSVLCPGLTRTRMLEATRQAQSDPSGSELGAAFVDAEQFAMDPLQVGQAVVDGIVRNDAYILPHSEFVDEVSALHRDLEQAFRTDLSPDPRRAAFEDVRRKATEAIRKLTRSR